MELNLRCTKLVVVLLLLLIASTSQLFLSRFAFADTGILVSEEGKCVRIRKPEIVVLLFDFNYAWSVVFSSSYGNMRVVSCLECVEVCFGMEFASTMKLTCLVFGNSR